VRALAIEKSERRIGPLAGVRDAHARARRDRDALGARREKDISSEERRAIVRATEIHRADEARRTVRARAHLFFGAGEHLRRAHEHGVTRSLRVAHDVEALVHAVHEEDVRGARRAEERARSLRESDPRVAREILRPAVRLRLDDARDALAVHDACADERTRHDARVALEERTLETN